MASRYRITFWVSILLTVIAAAALIADCLWGIQGHRWFQVAFCLYVVLAIVIAIVVRALEHHDNRASLWTRIYTFSFRVFNRAVAWWRLPSLLGSLNLLALRLDLREKNLYDTTSGNPPGPEWQPVRCVTRRPGGTLKTGSDILSPPARRQHSTVCRI